MWSTRNIAAARPIKPIFAVFSRRCGVSEIADAGIAIARFFLFVRYPSCVVVCVELKRQNRDIKMRVIWRFHVWLLLFWIMLIKFLRLTKAA